MDLHSIGRGLISIGVLLVVLGLSLRYLPPIPGLGRLPGDIFIKKDHFSFYFPITTCLIINIVLTALLKFFGKR